MADYVEMIGISAQEACDKTIKDLIEKVDGLGGAICIDNNGEIGVGHSSPCLLFGFSKDGNKMVGFSKDDLRNT